MMLDKNLGFFLFIATLLWVSAGAGFAGDQEQWGEKHTRNMISAETALIDSFDPETGANIKWTASLGSETWATPVVANGRVFLGTNNKSPRDPRHKGDRGILLCFDEKDGRFLWQLVVPKLGPDPYLDWPSGGIVSPVSVDGDRVYVVTNRGEVACLDVHGLSNGNDGPYTDEGRHMGIGTDQVYETTDKDADILWLFDIPGQAGTYPHDAAHSSILIDGDFLYINTSNGVDNTHRKIRKPDGPSLIVLDKNDGTLLARDAEGIGPRIFHSTWSSPSMGVVNGRKMVFFGGGDGVIYAFKALDKTPKKGNVKNLERVWMYDCDPKAPKENVHEFVRNRKEGPSNIKGMPVFYNNRIFVAAGGDIWWGKKEAWLHCIDATKQGDVTTSGSIWKYELNKHCCTTPSIKGGLLYITDCDGILHCLDVETGKAYWTHDLGGEIWASTMIADGKVYVGTKMKRYFIFEASKTKNLLHEIRLDSPISSTATAANGVLYVTTMNKLYALVK